MMTNKLFSGRFGVVMLLTLLLCSISFITRIALLVKSIHGIDFTFLNLSGIFLLGFFYDLVNATYFAIPLVVYLWLVSEKAFHKKGQRIFLYVLFYIFTFILLFTAISEWLFWDEFEVRFNFIAVDYLIYTTEVIGNIRQSYPIEIIIILLILASLVITYLLHSKIAQSTYSITSFGKRSMYALMIIILPVIFFFSLNNKLHRFSSNEFVNELAGNGMYELFAAYLNNELDYEQFYKKEDNTKAFQQLRTLIQTPESKFTSDNPLSIERSITHTGPEKKLNVVVD